jgi:hypothetical protein
MLDKATTLKDYTLCSTDGDIGSVKDSYFDDKHWTIRYLVAETGHWLTGRRVLISPYALHHAGPEEGYIAVPAEKPVWDPHLRSTNDVSAYHIQATDGAIGHVVDFIIDDETWEIRYLVVDTRSWWPGKRVLVSRRWIECVGWREQTVHLNLTREVIKRAPEYTEESLLTREYEDRLKAHYNRAPGTGSMRRLPQGIPA